MRGLMCDRKRLILDRTGDQSEQVGENRSPLTTSGEPGGVTPARTDRPLLHPHAETRLALEGEIRIVGVVLRRERSHVRLTLVLSTSRILLLSTARKGAWRP